MTDQPPSDPVANLPVPPYRAVQRRESKPRTRCAECGLRAWFIDGCPNCGRITEVIHDIA